jgi:hypothetical protein
MVYFLMKTLNLKLLIFINGLSLLALTNISIAKIVIIIVIVHAPINGLRLPSSALFFKKVPVK